MSDVVLELGPLGVFLAVLAATAGNLVGSLIAYGVGRAGSGREIGPRASRAFAACSRLFDRHGNRAVFIARLLPLARTFVSLPAGYSRVALGPFTAMTVTGCAIWAAGFTLLGVVAGAGWEQLSGTVGTLLLALTAVAVATWLVLQQRGSRAAR